MLRKLGMAALLVVLAGGAQAQGKSTERQIRDQLRAQGFSQIEIERDGRRIEVEARRGPQKLEMKYDARTGRVISQTLTRPGDRRAAPLWPGEGPRRSMRHDDDDDGGRRGGNRSSRHDDDDDDGGRRGGGRDDNDDDD
ncbi:MAG: PepSY domain-containing protein [Paracoccus sp. (in: a-proteobacteria)]|nr:PepSY domain-containing protein [Paracoccus sp. (in: a-proteobacteria)]